MKQSRNIIYQDGYRYMRLEDADIIKERKERRGYNRGRTDGEAMAVWKPPTSKDTPLPRINYDKLGKICDVTSYRKGFIDGYYALV